MSEAVKIDFDSDDAPHRARVLMNDGRGFIVVCRGRYLAALQRQMVGGRLPEANALWRVPQLRFLQGLLHMAPMYGMELSLDMHADYAEIRVSMSESGDDDDSPRPQDSSYALGDEALARFSETHKLLLADPSAVVRKDITILDIETVAQSEGLLDCNKRLHQRRWDPWPGYLVAFATQECGDYFAYDLRTEIPSVVYVDPDKTVEENLMSTELRV